MSRWTILDLYLSGPDRPPRDYLKCGDRIQRSDREYMVVGYDTGNTLIANVVTGQQYGRSAAVKNPLHLSRSEVEKMFRGLMLAKYEITHFSE